MKTWEEVKEGLYVGGGEEDGYIDWVIELSKKYNPPTKKLCIYAGSFNPFHIGHLNILEKAERIFGKGNVVLAIGCNPAKNNSAADNIKRAQELSEKIGRDVIAYTSFLHKLILKKEEEGYEVILIRGLRNAEDMAHEDNQLRFIYDFLDFIQVEYKLNVIFFRSDSQYDHISSSAIRQIESVDEEGLAFALNYLP